MLLLILSGLVEYTVVHPYNEILCRSILNNINKTHHFVGREVQKTVYRILPPHGTGLVMGLETGSLALDCPW